MGGLCYSEHERQTPWQRLAILFAGPGAGLLLYGLVELGCYLLGEPQGPYGAEVVWDLKQINLRWSLINLLPIWPLDGGQITGVILTMFNRRKGMNWTHVVSLVTASLMAMYVFQNERGLFNGIFFVLFALINYRVLQAHHHAAKYGALEEDTEWWKR
jgi:membrane-associated protease RseP (regulator of RpoE activity)